MRSGTGYLLHTVARDRRHNGGVPKSRIGKWGVAASLTVAHDRPCFSTSVLRVIALAFIVFLPASGSGMTILSADRTVYTELSDRRNGGSDPPPETVVVSDSFGGLGPFDSTVINHRTSIDQQFFTTPQPACYQSLMKTRSLLFWMQILYTTVPKVPGSVGSPRVVLM
jgi:hypothetical protein